MTIDERATSTPRTAEPADPALARRREATRRWRARRAVGTQILKVEFDARDRQLLIEFGFLAAGATAPAEVRLALLTAAAHGVAYRRRERDRQQAATAKPQYPGRT